MGFLIKGNFSGQLRGKCKEPLGRVLVKIYLKHSVDVKTGIAEAAASKYALEVLDVGTISSKRKFLIGKGKTDPWGNYEIRLAKKYQGGPIEIDIEVLEVPNQNRQAEPAVQFAVTTLQPVWRGETDELCYSWNYRIPHKFWTNIRSKLDAWVVCGYVKSSEDRRTPLAGVKVTAYDADWIQDDLIGAGVTDSSGRFQIDYRSSDFKHTFLTPLVNVETPISLISGPDIYFKVASAEGAMLYEEARNDGLNSKRRNTPKCFYIELFVSVLEEH